MTRALFAILLLAACSTDNDPGKANEEARPTGTTLHGQDGSVVVRLEVKGSTCTVHATDTLTVTAGKDRVELKDGESSVASLADGPNGRILADGDGTPVARLVAPTADRLELLDPSGVAQFRLRVKAASIVLRDRAGMPFRTVTREGGRWVANDRDGAVQAYVAGTDDPVVAGLLAADTTTLQHRTLLACDRLLTP